VGEQKRAHIGVMGEEGDEGDEEFAAGIETDRIGGVHSEDASAVVEGLDELKHGARCGWWMRTGEIRRGRDGPCEDSMSSVKARMAARGGDIWESQRKDPMNLETDLFVCEDPLESCVDVEH